ncbi:MAG: PIN domain-containing protein [Acidobacteria bacterium]|nr:PIN domain-containing protein [Acidobacteriota bacterium]
MICVLDACAMIALLRAESGEDVVWACLSDPLNLCFAHAINLCEVYYDFHRDAGEPAADSAIADLKSLGIIERNDFDEDFWKDAGKLKAGGKISLADCFAIALTNRISGTLLSFDHHELDVVAAAGICPITFIR